MPLHLMVPADPPGLALAPAWCGATVPAIMAMLFLTGLVGGLAHCGPMCGPFVLAQAAIAPGVPMLQRLGGALLLPYHLGRAATYAALGAVAAALGGRITAAAPVRLALGAVLLFAALLFLGQAIARIAPRSDFGRGELGRIGSRWAIALARLAAPLLASRSAPGRFALGAILGLLPCGFLYAALAAAAATGTPLAGAAAMAAFALGTVPSLLLVGLGGAALVGRWRGAPDRLLTPVFLFDGALLAAMATGVLVAAR